MVTFTLGLGLEGFMDYQSDYETSLTGDFAKIKAGDEQRVLVDDGNLQLAGPVVQRAEHARRPLARGGERARQVLQRERPELAHPGPAAGARLAQHPDGRGGRLGDLEPEHHRDRQLHLQLDLPHREMGRRDRRPAHRHGVGQRAPRHRLVRAGARSTGAPRRSSDSRDIFTIDESAGGKRKPFLYASLSSAPAGSIAAEQDYFDRTSARRCRSARCSRRRRRSSPTRATTW